MTTKWRLIEALIALTLFIPFKTPRLYTAEQDQRTKGVLYYVLPFVSTSHSYLHPIIATIDQKLLNFLKIQIFFFSQNQTQQLRKVCKRKQTDDSPPYLNGGSHLLSLHYTLTLPLTCHLNIIKLFIFTNHSHYK